MPTFVSPKYQLWPMAASLVLVFTITICLSQASVRLFFDGTSLDFRPYGLAYVAVCVLLTLFGGKRWGFLTLTWAAIGAAYLLPPRSSIAIGDALGWMELAGMIVLGGVAVLGTDAFSDHYIKSERIPFWLDQRRIPPWRIALNKHVYRAWSWSDRRRLPQYLIIFSHMRSGSSLLTHLLSTHPTICGYGETHLTYAAEEDLASLVGKVMLVRRKWPGRLRERYVLDKILHDMYLEQQALALLLLPQIRVLFLYREPRGTLKSLIRTFGFDESQALDHYQRRMASIARAAEALDDRSGDPVNDRAVAVSYRDLLQRTEEAFRLLEQYLGLSEPLSQEYRILPTTGKDKIGDPSANIRSGTILRERPESEIVLSEETLQAAEHAYRRCVIVLRRCCRMLPEESV